MLQFFFKIYNESIDMSIEEKEHYTYSNNDTLVGKLGGLQRGKMRLKSRNSQKAHLAPSQNQHTKFWIPTSIRREVIRETKLKNKKNPQKKFSRLWGDIMRKKNRDPENARLWPLLNLYTKFQLPCSIWRGVMPGTNSKNGKNWLKNYVSRSKGDVMGFRSQTI